MMSPLIQDMHQMIDTYFPDPELNSYLRLFLQDKLQEGLHWSELTICCHHMLGGSSDLIERSAALAELVILAIDIMDDIQDKDNPAKPWMQCPTDYALNAVCGYLMTFMAEAPSETMSAAGRLLALSINGQQKDLNGSVQTEAEYMEMIHQKSGSLLRFACHMGSSLVPNLSGEILERMDELAECVGVIAQLDNDLRDLSRFELKSDLLAKKRTLPILFLLRGGEEEFPAINRYYNGELSTEEFFGLRSQLMNYIQDSGCQEYTRVIQSLYIDRADELLESLPGTAEWKNNFRSLTYRAQLAPAAASQQ